ncbi:MAG: winged helix-turn-helix transcriptional regulator [Desulfurococcales archaeon]|nr:winged helix-turn-helix transcriptional regulator [Desulfurococcales archaeon]
MDLEELFESKGRFRILRFLLKEGQANISRIIRETKLPYRLVKAHLDRLVELGIVHEHTYGRLRLYEVNLGDPRINATRKLLEELERLWSGVDNEERHG